MTALMTTLDSLLGEHSEIVAIRTQIERLFQRQAEPARRLPPILIEGETGTGKGLLAAAIHHSGPRARAPFVDVNCAAIPETLLESELFGFERGAFTGAQQAKVGLLQAAHGGTIFLDEIGLMPEAMQAKLLKVIEERSVRRLGSTRSEPVDVSVIAAANIDLKAAIRSRRFREDLYHRLAVVTFRLPALRERGNDLLLLAEHFLNQACSDYGVPAKHLSSDMAQALKAHSWPGNVRELGNAMERIALLSDSNVVTANDFRSLHLKSTEWHPPTLAEPESLDDRVAALERAQMEEALEETDWNISHAATRLGLARNTFRYRMAKHGLAPRRSSPRPRSRPVPVAAADATRPKTAEPDAPGVRWERRRITFLQVTIAADNGETPGSDSSRMMEEFLGKTVTFGAKIGELRATRLTSFFGLEPAEDAPRRAVHMAMTVQNVARRAGQVSGTRPAVIVAIHTFQCLVGRLRDAVEIDSSGRREVQAVLDRLTSIATPNSIAVSHVTASFLGSRFNLEPLDGSGAGERAFRVLGLVEEDHAAAPFVGRRRELGLLEERFKRAESSQGQLVLLLGEAGIGKSRLLREFRRVLGESAMWTEGRAVSFGQSMPFYPLIDMLRHTFSIEDGDADPEIIAKIEAGLLASGERFRAALPFLQYLLVALPADSAVWTMDPKLRRAQIFDALRQFLVGIAEARPHVIVVEDVHWMDQATGEFLALLADALAAHNILVILTCRPGFSVGLEERTFHTRLALPALSGAESAQIAAALLESAELPEELRALIDRKAEGNPFFVEEITRSLLETKIIVRRADGVTLSRQLKAIDIPDTIEDVVLTRLERLDEEARRLLQSASVIGREFPRRLLDRLESSQRTPELLRELKATEFIYEKMIPESAYTFKHALIHEVTYNSMGEAQRRELHRRTGDLVEEIYADRLSEQYGVLAYHFSRAADWEKALEYLIKAAQQAALSFATLEALNLYDEALNAARSIGDGIGDPSTLIGIHQAKAALYFVTSQFDRSRAEAEQVLPLARLTSNSLKESEALAAIAWAATWSRDLDGAIDYATKALQVAEPAGATAVQARAHFTIGWVRAVTGVTHEGHLSLQKAIRLSEAAGDAVHRSLAIGAVGLIENWRGDYQQAAKLQTEALAIARERNLLVPLLFNLFLRGMTLTAKGDYDDALSMFQEGLALSQHVGDEAIHHRLLNCLGWLYSETGDLDRAQVLNEQSAQIGRRRNDPGTRPNAEVNLGELYMARGDLASAEEIFEGVHRYWLDPSTSQWMRFRYSIRLFCNMGELALAQGDIAKAKAMNALCFEGASRSDSRKNLVKAHRLEGEIARVRKEWQEAEYHLAQALDLARTIGNPPQLWKTHEAFGRLFEESGRHELASKAFNAARQVIDKVESSLQNPEFKVSFQCAGFVRKIRGLT
jgi:DNA-binding NtrC family response regulator/tetratricopeptide (TPR) repeat protein